MRVALIGTRGIPASHGGFETCMEEIGWRLAKRGHQVAVYSKYQGYDKKEYRGMKIVFIPRIPLKGFETLFASFLAVIHALVFCRYDFHMVFDNANAPVLLLLKLFNKNYSINTDGLGWKRDKWGFWAKKYYKWTESACVKFSKNIVSDSLEIQKYYAVSYNATTTMIAYGANIPDKHSEDEIQAVLTEFGLKKLKYILQVTRFEPENNPLLTLQAFSKIKFEDKKMLLIGKVLTQTSYGQKIIKEREINSNIILPGSLYDKKKLEILWTNSLCYIHGNQIGGTNPALLQAMAAQRPILARDCVFNREVLSEFGYFYDSNISSLQKQLVLIIGNMHQAEAKASQAFKRVKQYYDWDRITDQYESYFKSINGKIQS